MVVQTVLVLMGKPGRHCGILSRMSLKRAWGGLKMLWSPLPHLSDACKDQLWCEHAQLWCEHAVAACLFEHVLKVFL